MNWNIESLPTRTEILDADTAVIKCAEMGEALGFPGYQRILFGLPVGEALSRGYQITGRGIFEAVETPSAIDTANTIAQILGVEETKGMLAIDCFAGSGQVSAELSRVCGSVIVIEADPTTRMVCTHNLEIAQRTTNTTVKEQSMQRMFVESQSINPDIFYLDPPWDGNYKYDLNLPFSLSNMAPSGTEVVKAVVFMYQPKLVALKVPLNIDPLDLIALTTNLNCHMIFTRQLIEGYPIAFNQATAYMFSFDTEPQYSEMDKNIKIES